ncbi:ATP:cob(I)alamin adenosyltransferase [gamma proteobacterium HTCC5015]|nr:ATP:cob(I)alamin adenosyltransferase [gamma proteobacterium HTCC5015]
MKRRIGKVVTRTGDDGTTGLATGARLSKSAPRIHAIGEIDELNAYIGLLRALLPDMETLAEIQQQLFNIGGELAMADGSKLLTEPVLLALENDVAELNEPLPPLTEFILPAGGECAARCHLARAVARRAERQWIALAECDDERDTLNPLSGRYLNRLSDYFFVLARLQAEDSSQWRGTERPKHSSP